MKVVRAYRRPSTVRNYYRTSSYSGLPKGTYLVPNPRHFHLAHYTNINKPMKAQIINLVSGGKYSNFNPNLPSHFSYNWRNNLRPTVTINIANSRTITLNISMQTLTEFIYPFAAALNVVHNLPDSKTASCQTSYHTDQSNRSKVNITEITNNGRNGTNPDSSSESSCITSEGISEFESHILQSMREKMVLEINTNHSSTDFDSTHTIINSRIDDEEKQDQDYAAEPLVDICSNKTLENANANLAGGDIFKIYDEDNVKDSLDEQSLRKDFDFDESGYEASNELTLDTTEFDVDTLLMAEGDNAKMKTELQEKIFLCQKDEDSMVIDTQTIPIDSESNRIDSNLINIDAEVLSMAHVLTDRALELVRDYSIFEEAIGETMSLFKDGKVSNEAERSALNVDGNEDIEVVEEDGNNKFAADSAKTYQQLETERSQYTKSENLTTLDEGPKDTAHNGRTVNTSGVDATNSRDHREFSNKNNLVDQETETFVYEHAQKLDLQDSNQIKSTDNVENDIVGIQNMENHNLHAKESNVITLEDDFFDHQQYDQDVVSIEKNNNSDIQDTAIFTEEKVERINRGSILHVNTLNQETINNEDCPDNVDCRWPSEIVNAFPGLFLDYIDNIEEELEDNSANSDELVVLKHTTISDKLHHQNIDSPKTIVGDILSDTPVTTLLTKEQVGESGLKSISNKQYRERIDAFASEKHIQRTGNLIEEVNEEYTNDDKIISSDESSEIEKYRECVHTPETIEQDGTDGPFCLKESPDFIKEEVSSDEIGIIDQSVDTRQTTDSNEGCSSTQMVVPCVSDNHSDSTDTDCTETSAVEYEEEMDFDITEQMESIEDNVKQTNFSTEKANELFIKDQFEEDDILLEGVNFLPKGSSTNQEELLHIPKERDEKAAHKLVSIENINIVRNIMCQESQDEGISDCKYSFSQTDSINLNANYDTKLIELAEVIYGYIIKQCYEVTDFVLFPEVLYDECVVKMFSKLKELYSKYYCDIADVDKNELRINLANYLLKEIELSDIVGHDDSDSSDNISDKLFTISEFISDILDNFFDLYVNTADASDSWNGFSNLLAEKETCQSTPEDKVQPASKNVCKTSVKKKQTTHTINSEDKNVPTDEETLTFQAKKSPSGSELYWISINKSPKNEEKAISRKRVFIDVDNIPLKPPDDLSTFKENKHRRLLSSKRSKRNRCLSPIVEEPRRNLYDIFGEEDSRSSSPVLSAHTENFEYRETTDFLAGGDYVEFEKPESNVVMVNEAKFFRGHTSDYAYYVHSSGVVFHKHVIQPKQTDTKKLAVQSSYLSLASGGNDEGNWMGYENAKF